MILLELFFILYFCSNPCSFSIIFKIFFVKSILIKPGKNPFFSGFSEKLFNGLYKLSQLKLRFNTL